MLINPVIRFIRYMRKNGLFGATARAILRVWQNTIHTSAVVFAADCSAEPANAGGESGETIEWFSKERPVSDAVLEIYCRMRSTYQSERCLREQLSARIAQGSRLWILWHDRVIAALGWSGTAHATAPFYLPLGPSDTVIYDIETAASFRGRGMAGTLIGRIISESGAFGVRRCYIAAKTWNRASIHAIQKTAFRRLAIVRKMRIFGRSVALVKPA